MRQQKFNQSKITHPDFFPFKKHICVYIYLYICVYVYNTYTISRIHKTHIHIYIYTIYTYLLFSACVYTYSHCVSTNCAYTRVTRSTHIYKIVRWRYKPRSLD